MAFKLTCCLGICSTPCCTKKGAAKFLKEKKKKVLVRFECCVVIPQNCGQISDTDIAMIRDHFSSGETLHTHSLSIVLKTDWIVGTQQLHVII